MSTPDTERPPAPGAPAGPAEAAGSVRVVDRRWWARGEPSADGDADGPRTSDKPAYVQELEQRLAARDEELRTTVARYREASAEFEETRARLRRDVAKEVERGRRLLLADLLEIVDNLDRAVEAAAAGGEALRQGIQLVRDQLLARLQAHGVTRLASLRQPFDPVRHEAATVVPVTDRGEDGMILGVIREGYLVGEDVLRPALVAVARYGEDGGQP